MARNKEELPPEELHEEVLPREEVSPTEAEAQEIPPAEAVKEGAAPGGEAAVGEVGAVTTAAQPKPSLPPAVKSALRWLAGIAVVFLIGFLCALFLLYRPQSTQLKQANSARDLALTQVAQVQTEAADLTQQLKQVQTDLASAQEDTARLTDEVNMANLHVKLDRVQKDVYAALSALKDQDTSYARLLLTNTPKTLDEISASLNETDKGVITEVQKRLANALDSLNNNPDIAQRDLQNITTILKDLEDKLFPAQ